MEMKTVTTEPKPKRKKGNSRGPIKTFTHRIDVTISKSTYEFISDIAKSENVSKAKALRMYLEEIIGKKRKV